ncbi:MAG TPA: squalene/phytoene synthase family protein [Mycobacteriales bacterium]|nr:squalene/phytoene synthase family protein [Mycobacteriales bacterium]
MTPTLAAAYRTCETVTKRQARNFHYGIRLLPPSKRAALSAVYALARRIDDIGDGDLPLDEKRRRLAEQRAALSRLGDSSDPVLLAVHDVACRLPVPVAAFDELIEGVEMDLDGRRFGDDEELVAYCRCVAGSIGRLCLGVFGTTDPVHAPGYADALGVALQLTNILRDIREDLLAGRIYLPLDDLAVHGVELRLAPDGRLAAVERLDTVIGLTAARARDWYDRGLRLLPSLDRRSAACASAMSGIYRRLLDRISADPTLVYGGRLALSPREKAGIAARAVMGQSRSAGRSAAVRCRAAGGPVDV